MWKSEKQISQEKDEEIKNLRKSLEKSYNDAINFGKWLDKNAQQRDYYPMEAMSMEELFDQFKK